jgi:hypothetical protein
MVSPQHAVILEAADVMVCDMQEHPGLTLAELQDRHPLLIEQNRAVFQMIADNGTYDRSMLIWMMQQAECIQQGHVTHEQGDVVVGQRLFDKFVRPVVTDAE